MDPGTVAPLSVASLKKQYIGRSINDLPTPSPVLDRAVVKLNCQQMLESCRLLGVKFRPHIKTHKTVEVTQLQVGNDTEEVNIIVSTVAEAEHLEQYLRDCRAKGKIVNVLLGFPLPGSAVKRLASLGTRLGPGSISVLIDHHEQLKHLSDFGKFQPRVFLKIDTGYHRAGLLSTVEAIRLILSSLLTPENGKRYIFAGLYSHSGHSYANTTIEESTASLRTEIESLVDLAHKIHGEYPQIKRPLLLSMGATPSATSIQSLVESSRGEPEDTAHELLSRLGFPPDTSDSCTIELHAGVYTLLDLQQIHTQASPSASKPLEMIGVQDMAFTILVEVASLYPHRLPPEGLIGAGTIALGREPCPGYGGWGLVSNWVSGKGSRIQKSGWQVGKISQEHGILKYDESDGLRLELQIGQKLRVWPNHACIAGVAYSVYFVVDKDVDGGDTVVDVWERCRGW